MKNLIYILFIFAYTTCTSQIKTIDEPISPIVIKLIDDEVNNKIIFCDTINRKAIANLNLTIDNKLQIIETELVNIRVKTREEPIFKQYDDSEIEKYSLFFQGKSFLNRLKIIQNKKNFNNFPFREKIYIPFEIRKCEGNTSKY